VAAAVPVAERPGYFAAAAVAALGAKGNSGKSTFAAQALPEQPKSFMKLRASSSTA